MITEMNIEKPTKFELLQKALSVSFKVDIKKILEVTEYWDLENTEGYLGVELMIDEREYQTFAVIHENPDIPRDVFEIGPAAVEILQCKATLPFPGEEGDQFDPTKLIIFSPDRRKFIGYGENEKEKFEITSISEILMN